MAAFVYPRGEPIAVRLRVKDAGSYNPATLTVVMKLKSAVNNLPPPESVPAVATFDVTYVPANGSEAAYWYGVVSEVIDPGLYCADAEISFNGSVIRVADFVLISVIQSVTPA